MDDSDTPPGDRRDKHSIPARNPAFRNLLTEREWEVLDLQAVGYGYKEIAAFLGISHSTVKNHLSRVHQKLAVHNLGGALSKAYLR